MRRHPSHAAVAEVVVRVVLVAVVGAGHELSWRHLRHAALLHGEVTHVQHGAAPGGVECGVHGGRVGHSEGGRAGQGVRPHQFRPHQVSRAVGGGAVV